MLQREYSAIRSTFINLPVVIKIIVLSIFEWLFYTAFTVSTLYRPMIFSTVLDIIMLGCAIVYIERSHVILYFCLKNVQPMRAQVNPIMTSSPVPQFYQNGAWYNNWNAGCLCF